VRMGGAEELFFVAEVDFDIPSPEISLDELVNGYRRIGCEEKSGFCILPSSVFLAFVAQRGNDDNLEDLFLTGDVPFDVTGGKKSRMP